MVCERHNNALNDAAAGASRSKELDAHLAGCANCRAQLARLQHALQIADQQMAQLAAAEPSAGFVPRIRAAVVEANASSRQRLTWLWPALATAATVVVALVLVIARRQPHETEMAAATRATPQPVAIQPIKPAADLVVADAEDRASKAPVPASRTPARRVASEPEVLVPAGESQALLQLVALMAGDFPVPPTLASADGPSPPLAKLRPIEIKPLEIVPLDPVQNTGT